MPINRYFGWFQVNLLGDVFCSTDLLLAAVADLSFGRNIVGYIRAAKLRRYLSPALILLSLLFCRFLGRQGIKKL